MVSLKRGFGVVFALLLMGLAVLPGYAQTPAQVVINYPELTEVDDALQLGLYFTITNSNGRVVPDAKVQSARVLLDDGNNYDATVELPTSPFFIVLVLDASGTMTSAAEPMRQAAIQAVNAAPEEARLALIRFNDRVDVLEEFTEDRNSIINAIGEVQPVNLAGTCLYDSVFEAVRLVDDAPPGRRAIILFTDGERDETAQGTVCSRHTYDEVVEFANQPASRVPIHTIGLSNRDQNFTELRSMASDTGGLTAVGEQEELDDLFQQIIEALKSQWLAKVLIYPLRGTHTATLTVTLEDGTVLPPVAVQFEALRDYQIPITPTLTPTPVIVNLAIQSATVDLGSELVYFDVTVQGEQVISQYRFDFFDADTNILLDSVVLPAPLTPPVAIEADLLRGDIRVEMRALDQDGQIISFPSGERDETIDRVTYEFAYIRPTATPLPASVTPIPVGIELEGIGYDQASDTITLDLSIIGIEQMGSLEITIRDADTNLRATVYNTTPAESIQLAAEGLTPLRSYVVVVTGQSPAGQNLVRSNEEEFTYTPLLTPTPTRTPTPTPTATTRPPSVAIDSIGIDETTGEIIIKILTEDEDRIDSYKLQIRNSQTGLIVGDYVHQPPPFDSMRIPLASLLPGEYEAVLQAFNAEGSLLVQAPEITFAYLPPATPTPTPSPTPSATPTPEPKPSLPERVTDAVRDNPALTLVVVLVGFALLAVLLLLLRPRRKPATGTGFLASQTGFYQMPTPPEPGAGKAARPAAAPPAQATQVEPGYDAEKTNVYMDSQPPLATLSVVRSPSAARLGPTVQITAVPFKIGRGSQEANDLSLDEDTGVSRSHAVITYQAGVFYLTDQGSSNGTQVEGVRLAPQTPVPLRSGAQITIGKHTDLVFTLPGGGGATMVEGPIDPDKTDYINVANTR